MFGKRKCKTPPVFKAPLHAESAERERAAFAALVCDSGEALSRGALLAPNTTSLMKASQAKDAVWMFDSRLDCARCRKSGSITVSYPGDGAAPNDIAVRSKARPDVYALQHAFLPEWFLTQPDQAISILSTKLDGWQEHTMKQIAGVVERTPGNPMPITGVQVVGTPGEATSLLIDFITPRAPIEAHYALLAGGTSPRFLMSEKTHLGEDGPMPDLAGITEWAFAGPDNAELKHTAIDLLPDTTRSAFFMAAVALLKRRLA
ncbi:MAG: hypothetical protein FP825_01545 [Hyphomonas sp.]|uniref:hypothetical protein n=1 Tax=Hyphomonas sp. TaxID=87 RepID=UPI00185C007C|nr:hypothetical protein [Hyphomonas sp.]MBA3067148.1 hypothetical protein [Hyphomonas sp.]MBU4061242.1 hypothetical protein [Alphaproteobacteria bacterium]MBU4165154.1 hypothetical protein [Alphaproteobacteria bacterium]